MENEVIQYSRITQFADDICIYQRRNSHAENCNELQKGLNIINSWLNNRGLEINISKSAVITFTRKYNVCPPKLTINNQQLTYKTEIKYLGMWLDHKLSWERHIKHTIQQVQQNQQIFKYLAGRWWGANQNTLLLLYNALIRARIEYGSFLVDNTFKKHDKKLEQAIYPILKIISGINGKPAREALYVELNVMPTKYRRQILAAKFLLKNYQSIRNIINPKIQLLQEIYKPRLINRSDEIPALISAYQLISTYDIIRMPNYACYSLTWKEVTYKRNIIMEVIDTRKKDPMKIEIMYRSINIQTEYFIYTDGSKQAEGVGASFYSPQLNISMKFKLPKLISIYTAESFAISRALLYVKTKKLSNIMICTDAKSVLNRIRNFNVNISENWYIINIIHLLYELRNQNVTLAWVPGHSKITGNEKADELAKEAIKDGLTYNIKIPSNDIRQGIWLNQREKWNTQWEQYTINKAKYYALIQPNIQKEAWFSKGRYTREIITLIIRIRMNSAQTPEYLYKIKKKNNSKCECGHRGTIDHMLLGCKTNHSSIDQMYKDFKLQKIIFPIDTKTLVYSPNPKIIQALFKHVTRCKMNAETT